MQNAIFEHYERVLARHYSDLAGDFELAAQHQLSMLRELGLTCAGERTLDLGAGAGLQAIPLARAGCDVTAVDLSPTLLGELSERGRGLSITSVEADLLAYTLEPGPLFGLAVCMGDTLLHLPSRASVEQLFRSVLRRLEPGAAFVTSFRDLSEERHGLDRFLTLVNRPGLRMRCFLEYEQDRVVVHDFIDELAPDGTWYETKGAYTKLRLSPSWVETVAVESGFTDVRSVSVRGLWLVAGRRPTN